MIGGKKLGEQLAKNPKYLNVTDDIDQEYKFAAEHKDSVLEELFADVYATNNVDRSLDAILHGEDVGGKTWKDDEGKVTWDHCQKQGFFQQDHVRMYERMKKHQMKPGHTLNNRHAFRNAFNRKFKKCPACDFEMIKFIAEWCSQPVYRGGGFMLLDHHIESQLQCDGDFPLKVKVLHKHGLVPLRRSGHAEYEYAYTYYRDTLGIEQDECYRLMLANAAGEDVLSGGWDQVKAVNPDLPVGMMPTIGHLQRTLQSDTPLDLIVCDGNKGAPDLSGNMSAILCETTGMFMIETAWPGKTLGHWLVYDAERRFLLFGRCGDNTVQTTLVPAKHDWENPMERLKIEFGFEFQIKSVGMLMLKTKRLEEVPLAAYEFSPEMKQKMQDKVKKRMLFEQETKVSKRTRRK